MKGEYGPYAIINNKFYKIPANVKDPSKLTLEQVNFLKKSSIKNKEAQFKRKLLLNQDDLCTNIDC